MIYLGSPAEPSDHEVVAVGGGSSAELAAGSLDSQQAFGSVSAQGGGSPFVPPAPSPKMAQPVRPAMPKEPWYYAWLSGVAKVGWGMAKVVLLITIILSLVAAVSLVMSSGGAPESMIAGLLAAIVPIVAAVAATFGTFFWSALLMLAVDCARNVRAARYGA
jgi:hypothetical protein